MRRRALGVAFTLCIWLIGCGEGDLATNSLPSGERLPGQIVADGAVRAWFSRYPDGAFFLAGPGDPEDFLYRGVLLPDGTREGDQHLIIERLRASGANSLYFQVIRSHGGDGDRTHNPFIDHDPANPLNANVLAQWNEWLTSLEEAGIVVVMFLYDDSALVWNTGDFVSVRERQFIRGIVNAFEHHGNIIWAVAEEYGERYSPRRVSNIAAEIRMADRHGHPIAVHKNTGVDFSELADDPHIDQFAAQLPPQPPAELHRTTVGLWDTAAGRYNVNVAEM
ncbi:MAG: hypothetical protein R3284_10100, partial [Rubricoccaceae bacterium]|nr:hypothetical protein [Rubricoccaceae bacterium]